MDGAAVGSYAALLPGLERLWHQTSGDPGVCIAVLDGPVDVSHPCFEGANLQRIETLAKGVPDDGPATQHGTHVASVIFGQHGSPVRGIAPGCRGLIVPVFRDAQGDGVAPCSQVDLARAITQAVEAGAQVINISGGQLMPSDKPEQQLASAIQLCLKQGVLIVAAAGNDGCECLHIPAAAPSVLVVGAMDEQGNPMQFSNWGGAYQAKGVLAPGRNITGAAPSGKTVSRTGTSFATPIVSGLVGLLLSLQRKRGEAADPHAIGAALLNSAIGCDVQPVSECRRLLAGRLNLAGTLDQLKHGGTVNMSEQEMTPEAEQVAAQAPETVEAPADPMPAQAAVQAAEAPAKRPPQAPARLPMPAAPAPVAPAPAAMPRVMAASMPDEITPSECATCGDGNGPQLAYVLGQVGYDFGTEARRDWFGQRVGNPDDHAQMVAYLNENPEDAAALIWTLTQEAVTVYAIHPAGTYAEKTFELLRAFLKSQLPAGQGGEGVELVAIPGYVGGKVGLLNGQTVPAIVPDRRGMFSWETAELAKHVAKGKSPTKAELQALVDFLRRVFYELRNLGTAPHDRAINFAATHAFDLVDPIGNRHKNGMELDSIDAQPSAICRPGADCWDVVLTFFDPENLNRAREVTRITVDVSDVIPLRVGEPREWRVR